MDYIRRFFEGCSLVAIRGELGNRLEFSEEPDEEGEDKAQEDRGHEREVETDVAVAVLEVAGEAAEPATANSCPEDRAEGGDGQTYNDQ